MEQPRPGYTRPNQAHTQGETDLNQPAKREIQISQTTKDKAEAAREFIEKKYSKRKQEEEERREKWDLLLKEMDNMDLTPSEKERIKRDILHKEAINQREKRRKISTRDFDPIAIIGRGAFGEVRLCRWKTTGEVIAMKKMNKSEMEKKNQTAHVRAERNILANAQNPWIVELKCSFQDDRYLYLVMEYLAGGDLMTLLMKKDILTEEESKFYIAEAILAVASVHKLNYIHRDLKPDNILLDSKGHLKLSDFGLCKHTDIKPRFEFRKMDDNDMSPVFDGSNLTKKPQNYTRNRKKVFTIVGTPDYIAPEVFGQKGYTETVDWWSLGTILFEMLVGYPPFLSDNPSITCKKIIHWKQTFVIPPEANLSPAATDLLRKLICDPSERLGINGVEEIKLHPFFAGIDWKRIREKKAPYIPEIKSDIDTSNFDKFEEEEPWYVEDTNKTRKLKKAGNFIGYTFKRDFENQRPLIATALENLESYKNSQPRQKTQQQNQRAQAENIDSQATEAKEYKKEQPSYSNLAQTSLNNISNALNSITGNYQLAQSKKPAPAVSPYQLQNQKQNNQYTNDSSYYSNYSSNKSVKGPTSTKQTFYNLPENREKGDSRLRPSGQGTDNAKKPTTPSSYIRPPGPSMMGSASRGMGGGLYKGGK